MDPDAGIIHTHTRMKMSICKRGIWHKAEYIFLNLPYERWRQVNEIMSVNYESP